MDSSLLLALTLAVASPATLGADFSPRSDARVELAQVPLSNKCVTPQMVCSVGMQPIGSQCFCGQFAGIILP